MTKGNNSNHPKEGSMIKVGPIRDLQAIQLIKSMITNPMHYALFVIGINTNLRASDLMQLTFGQVRGLKVMEEVEIVEKKTGKHRRISLNEACVKAIEHLDWPSGLYPADRKLFTGRRGPLTVPSVHRLVKRWCGMAGLQGNYGSHTLRKTWGYHQRTTFGSGMPELVKAFNHSSERQTLEYLCVQPEEVRSLYANQL